MYRYSIKLIGVKRLDATIQGAIKKQDGTVQAANDFYVTTEIFSQAKSMPSDSHYPTN